MKILVLSNFYPPHHIGGYGALCEEVVDGLVRRGHTVDVLTSTHGVGQPHSSGWVHRELALESDLNYYRRGDAWTYPMRRRHNLRALRRRINTMQPDLVFVWGMWNLSKSLALEAERVMGPRVVYYLANPWPIEANAHHAYWDMPATTPLRRVAKRLLRVPARLLLAREWKREPLQFLRAACCSEAQRTQLLAAGIELKDAPVLYEGIDLAPYLSVASARRTEDASEDVLKLLYVGILAEHKGIHTAIEALAHLTPLELQRVHFTILGSGHPAYEAHLRKLVEKLRLADRVDFSRPIPRTQLPALLGGFDVLLLPSVWAEPLARIMQEGLAAGMAVIGSSNGGTKETIVHGHNGLLFQASHAQDLAAQITALLTAPQLRAKLAEQGVNTAVERFDIARMIDEVEEYLMKAAEAGPTTETLLRPELASADSRL